MKVAIMQPYFVPYAGYFRLFSTADLFVIYDCVQFPRRGWVHRNRFLEGEKENWVTLPLEKCSRDTLIKDLRFRSEASSWFDDLVKRYAFLAKVGSFKAWNQRDTLVDYLEKSLGDLCRDLAIPFDTLRSSELPIRPELRGQDRILEICRQVGAKEYINLSGGADLYDASQFKDCGIDLRFLKPYQGSYESILARVYKEPLDLIREEIVTQCDTDE